MLLLEGKWLVVLARGANVQRILPYTVGSPVGFGLANSRLHSLIFILLLLI